jgi:hypothetical protein
MRKNGNTIHHSLPLLPFPSIVCYLLLPAAVACLFGNITAAFMAVNKE